LTARTALRLPSQDAIVGGMATGHADPDARRLNHHTSIGRFRTNT
jgi:hypothetical protein